MVPNPELLHAPLSSSAISAALLTSVLLASILGSAHCAGMCGSLVLATVQNRRAWLAYHFARLAGYLLLGAIAGWFGSHLLSNRLGPILHWAATLSLAAGFSFVGIRILSGRAPHPPFPKPFARWINSQLASSSAPATVGFLTAFLPCGWLYSFVLGAIATRHPGSGALFLLSFWLGTLPALTFAPSLIRGFLRPWAIRAPMVSGGLLLAAAVFTLALRIVPQARASFWPSTSPSSMNAGMDCPLHRH